MRYFIALGGFIFCLVAVTILVLVMGVIVMVFSGIKPDQLSEQFWTFGLLGGGALGFAAGCHSFRASLARFKKKNDNHDIVV